jgi:hypothetical protein
MSKLRIINKNLMKIALLTATLMAAFVLGSCTTNQLETETTTSSSTPRSSTRVVKDEIPAEGERKIPVIEQY